MARLFRFRKQRRKRKRKAVSLIGTVKPFGKRAAKARRIIEKENLRVAKAVAKQEAKESRELNRFVETQRRKTRIVFSKRR